jgi:acetolactate synthase I/II/III large subunit
MSSPSSSTTETVRTDDPPTVAHVVAAALRDAGTQVAFTFPGGGSNLALLEELQAQGVATVLARSELGGALMAATVADITGNPGVLIVGLGPGAASAVNGIAHAMLDRSPVVLVSDRYAQADAETSAHQLLDQAAIFAPIVKSVLDAHPADVGETVPAAIDAALTTPRGPVLIEIRRDRARAPVVSSAADIGEGHPTSLHDARSDTGQAAAASAAAASGAAAAASAAVRPVLLVGEEARRDLDQGGLADLAQALSAPVLTTYKAKGVFAESHPLWAGILTGAAIERPLLAEADLFITVGLDPVELLARPWPFDAPVVALRRATAPDSYLKPRWALTGELERSLRTLTGGLTACQSAWAVGDSACHLEAMRAALRGHSSNLSAIDVVGITQEVLGDPIVTVDAGAHMFAATWFWRSARPNRFHISNGLATMGFAVPAAIGAAIARPGETVVALTGDGGFTINAAELETAARVGAKVIVVVLNDASLSLIRVKQAEIGWRRSNVDFVRSDFATLAEGFGVRGLRANTADGLRDALALAHATDGTSVIDVAIDGEEYGALHRTIRGSA